MALKSRYNGGPLPSFTGLTKSPLTLRRASVVRIRESGHPSLNHAGDVRHPEIALAARNLHQLVAEGRPFSATENPETFHPSAFPKPEPRSNRRTGQNAPDSVDTMEVTLGTIVSRL